MTLSLARVASIMGRQKLFLTLPLLILSLLSSPSLSHAVSCSNAPIAAGELHTVGLKQYGTVVAVGYYLYGQLDVSSWTTIKAIAAGEYHTVGLKEDGTVVAVGNNSHGQVNVSSWTNIKAIAAGGSHTVGLKEDGTVVAVGWNPYGQLNVSSWSNIKAIAAGRDYTVGLKEDGTVVVVGSFSGNVSSWTNIKAIAAGKLHIVGLKEDGTVVAAGNNDVGQLNVSSWTNIKAIAAGGIHTVGLKETGTVVAAGSIGVGGNVSSWTNIKAVAAGGGHAVGLKENGTVVATGRHYEGQLEVSSWSNIMPECGDCVLTANAGGDQTVEQTSSAGAYVTLDGSGSQQQGCAGDLTYSWSWPGGSATGANPTVLLPSGITNVALTLESESQTATDTVAITVQDTQAPSTTTMISAIPGTNEWYVSDVTITLNAFDAGSGVKEIHYTIDGTETVAAGDSTSFTIATEGTHGLTYYSVDNALNPETPHPPVTIKIDKTLPTITAAASSAPNVNGWYNTDVTVGFACNDALSGIASCTQPITVSIEGQNRTVSGTALDNAGLSSPASVSLNLDKTPPLITITGITNGAMYTVGAVPTAGYTVTDNISGVASQSSSLVGGNGNGVGTYTYTVNAMDLAGNPAQAMATYTVVYGFSGFLEPVSLDRLFKLGSTIPVKFRLTDGLGNYISTAVATISVQQFSGEDPVGDPIILSSNGADTGNVFRYDAADNLYIYNLGTKDLLMGSWQIQATHDDETVKTAFIFLKKN